MSKNAIKRKPVHLHVECKCGWQGKRCELIHDFVPGWVNGEWSFDEGDADPVDRCPICREEC